jgi:hypothetical protein
VIHLNYNEVSVFLTISLIAAVLFLGSGCFSPEQSNNELTKESFNKSKLKTQYEFSCSGDVMFQNISSVQADQYGNVCKLP